MQYITIFLSGMIYASLFLSSYFGYTTTELIIAIAIYALTFIAIFIHTFTLYGLYTDSEIVLRNINKAIEENPFRFFFSKAEYFFSIVWNAVLIFFLAYFDYQVLVSLHIVYIVEWMMLHDYMRSLAHNKISDMFNEFGDINNNNE